MSLYQVIILAVTLVSGLAVLIGLIVLLLKAGVTIEEIAAGAGTASLKILTEANTNQALLDSIEGNKTGVPVAVFAWSARSMAVMVRLALLVDPNDPRSADALKLIDELDKFEHNITDGQMPTLPPQA